MAWKRARPIAAIMIVMAAVIVWRSARQPLKEPSYGGKTVSEWLGGFDNYDDPNWLRSKEAIQKMGAQAVPVVMMRLQAKDSFVPSQISFLFERLIKSENADVPATVWNSRALAAFMVLGDEGKTAVPDLIASLAKVDQPQQHRNVITALGWIGPSANVAMPALLNDLKSNDAETHFAALDALRKIHGDAAQMVPTLIDELQDPHEHIRNTALATLGDYGVEARAAFPVIEKIVQIHDERYNRDEAIDALKKIKEPTGVRSGK